MRITEAGLINIWAEQIIHNRRLHSRMALKSRHEPHPLYWVHLEGAFFVLAMGFILSLWIFCVENCLARTKRRCGREMQTEDISE